MRLDVVPDGEKRGSSQRHAARGNCRQSTEWLTIGHRAPSLASLSADHQCHDDCGPHLHARAADLARRRPSVRLRADRRGPHGRGRLRDRRGAGTDASDDPDGHRAGADAVPRRAGPAPHASGSCTGWRSSRATGAAIAAYAISGLEIALLDIKGKTLGAPVAELLGGFCRDRVPVVGYLFIDEPEANARKAKAFVDAGYSELKLKVGRDFAQDHDTHRRDPRRGRAGREAADRREHDLERPGGDQVDPRPRAVRPAVRRAAGARLRRRRASRRCAARSSVPIAADEACTDVRSALELVKQDACDVFVVYPSEAGGLTRARQIAAIAEAAGKWCAIGSWAELGPATVANAHLVAATTTFAFRERHALPAAARGRAHAAARPVRRAARGAADLGSRRRARS